MGINGLWKLIAPSAERRSLRAYCAERASNRRNSDDPHSGYLRIGVDLSTLILECQSAAAASETHGYLEGGTIYILFTKLAMYLRCPATFVFVLDGVGRPELKRGQQVLSGRQLQWVPVACSLIRMFGYHVHQAPGEAEAELAMLNRLGFIDAIITSDSDVFVFGGTHILRSIPSSKKDFDDEIDVLTTRTLFDPNGLALSPAELVFFALAAGGDYDGVGIPGCGSVMARNISKCGFATQLVDIVATSNGQPALRAALNTWSDAIRHELRTNSQGLLPRRAPAMADALPTGFPDVSVVEFYCNPVISPSHEIVSATPWLLHPPMLPQLRQFCALRFLWISEAVSVTRFSHMIWEGALLQAFYSPLSVYDESQQALVTPDLKITIVSLSWRRRRGRYAKQFGIYPIPRIVCNTSCLIRALDPSFGIYDQTLTIWPQYELLPQPLRKALRRIQDGGGNAHASGSHFPGMLLDLTAPDSE